MRSSNPSFSQFGVDAMNGYFMANSGGMLGADVPPFHPSMPAPDHGGYGLGDAAVGGATAATDIGAQFAVNNLMLAPLASQLFAPPPQPHGDHRVASTPPEEEMSSGYGVGGADRPGQSDAHALALWPSSKKTCCDWSNGNGSRTVSLHGTYQLAGPPEAAGFYYHPQAAGHSTATPSELSLSLCSKSSSDSISMTNATKQFSPEASRSCLTHVRRVQPELPQQQAHCPQARFRPVRFAVVVARSPYAPVGQQVLNDVVGRVLHGVAEVAAADSGSGVGSGTRLSSLQASSCSASAASAVSSNDQFMASTEEHSHGARWGEAQRVRSELLKMLRLMDQKYNQCLDEIQSTTARFNSLMLSGSGHGGSICAPFAHRAVSATYLALRRRITGEIMVAASMPSQRADSSTTSVGERERSWESAFIQKHLAAQQHLRRRREQQCWRPQRGLPEKSVAVLKAWMFENFVRPYPMDREKDMLAARSGLTRNQVANWFINARVRLWRPLIEELHEELKRSSGGPPMEHMSRQYVVG